MGSIILRKPWFIHGGKSVIQVAEEVELATDYLSLMNAARRI
ncbi:MAG: hypothetical protein ACXQT5_06300 [Candidatus Syntropharchaeia archaeon]